MSYALSRIVFELAVEFKTCVQPCSCTGTFLVLSVRVATKNYGVDIRATSVGMDADADAEMQERKACLSNKHLEHSDEAVRIWCFLSLPFFSSAVPAGVANTKRPPAKFLDFASAIGCEGQH